MFVGTLRCQYVAFSLGFPSISGRNCWFLPAGWIPGCARKKGRSRCPPNHTAAILWTSLSMFSGVTPYLSLGHTGPTLNYKPPQFVEGKLDPFSSLVSYGSWCQIHSASLKSVTRPPFAASSPKWINPAQPLISCSSLCARVSSWHVVAPHVF